MSKFNIYPSLLDKFQELLDYQEVAEQPWNKVSEAAHARGEHLDKEVDDYILSPDEMAAKIEVELINTINRCPKEPNEAADKGTCFNEVIDCLINNAPTKRLDLSIRSIKRQDKNTLIEAKMNGFTFYFDANMCKAVAEYYKGAICQYLVSAPLDTKYGEVNLYGYIDEWVGDIIYDIKTTSMYNFGKFSDKTQKLVYPFCAIESGLVGNIEQFEYSVFKWTKTKDYITEVVHCDGLTDNMDDYYKTIDKPIEVHSAEFFPECYTYNHSQATQKLRMICERFIEWLESRKDYITDKKIFNGENAVDYIGKPIEQL